MNSNIQNEDTDMDPKKVRKLPWWGMLLSIGSGMIVIIIAAIFIAVMFNTNQKKKEDSYNEAIENMESMKNSRTEAVTEYATEELTEAATEAVAPVDVGTVDTNGYPIIRNYEETYGVSVGNLEGYKCIESSENYIGFAGNTDSIYFQIEGLGTAEEYKKAFIEKDASNTSFDVVSQNDGTFVNDLGMQFLYLDTVKKSISSGNQAYEIRFLCDLSDDTVLIVQIRDFYEPLVLDYYTYMMNSSVCTYHGQGYRGQSAPAGTHPTQHQICLEINNVTEIAIGAIDGFQNDSSTDIHIMLKANDGTDRTIDFEAVSYVDLETELGIVRDIGNGDGKTLISMEENTYTNDEGRIFNYINQSYNTEYDEYHKLTFLTEIEGTVVSVKVDADEPIQVNDYTFLVDSQTLQVITK